MAKTEEKKLQTISHLTNNISCDSNKQIVYTDEKRASAERWLLLTSTYVASSCKKKKKNTEYGYNPFTSYIVQIDIQLPALLGDWRKTTIAMRTTKTKTTA